MNKKLFILILGLIMIGLVIASSINVTLNSPSDNYISTTSDIIFNVTSASSGANITNVTLYNNISGTWESNGTNLPPENNVFDECNDSWINTSLWSGGDSENTEYLRESSITISDYQQVTGEVNSIVNLTEDILLINNISIRVRLSGYAQHTGYANQRLYLGSEIISRLDIPGDGGSQSDDSNITLIRNNSCGENCFDVFDDLVYEESINITDSLIRCTTDAVNGGQGTPYASSYCDIYYVYYTTGFPLETTTFSRTISESTLWNVQTCDTDGDCNFSVSNYTVFLDNSGPVINISSPSGESYIIDYETPSYPIIDLNFSVSDDNLDSCWYNYNSTNISLNCSENTTFQTNNQTNVIIYANDTVGNINSSTVSWIYSYYINNDTIFTTDCNDSEINWTNLPDGEYEYNITTCNVFGYCNSTETRTVYLDTTSPLIEYASNSQANNKTADFTSQDWIFVNVSVNELNLANTTFVFYTSSDSDYNTTTFSGDGESFSINITSLQDNMYFWNVTSCDYAGSCNTTETMYYGDEDVNLSLNLSFSNIISELGSDIVINGTSNFGVVCIDVDHPNYGLNYSCEQYETEFKLIINWFRKTIYNDTTITKTLEFIGTQAHNLFFPAHQYDEVDNVSINITGINTTDYPYNVQVNLSNSSIDRIFPGWLIGSNIYNNKLNTGSNNIILYYSNIGSQIIEFFMDDGADLIELTFNISGFEFGFEYFDEFDNESVLDGINNEGMFRGGFALPKGINLASFVYDTFTPTGEIDDILWTATPDGTYYSGPIEDRFIISVDNSYNGGLILDLELAEQFSDNSGSYTATDASYANYTLFNIWTSQEIDFTMEYENYIDRYNSDGICNIHPKASLGGVEFFNAPFQVCDDTTTSDCNAQSTTIEPLVFHLERAINNSWNISISGVAETSGDDIDGGACGRYDYIYNYSNGSLSKTYQYPGIGGCPFTNSVTNLSNFSTINDLEWNIADNIVFKAEINAYYTDISDFGCTSADSNVNISGLNRSLYSLYNSSIISNSIFDSSGDITTSTLDMNNISIVSGTITPYLSANNGDNWEVVIDNSEHSFTYPGKNMKYRYDFELNQSGYVTSTQFIVDMNITTPIGYPSNLTFDLGNDGIIDANFSGELNSTNSPFTINVSSGDISSAFNITPQNSSFPHLFEVPLSVYSESTGEILIDAINLTYNPNPISLNVDSIFAFLVNSINFVNFPIGIEATNGNITVNDIRYDYAGGNSTIEVTAHSADYSQNVTRNVTYYYSRWDYSWVPSGVEWIYFAPTRPTSQNVTPYGQSSVVPLLNITNYGYGGLNATLSILQNDTLACVNTTISLDNNKSNGVLITENWTDLTNLTYLEAADIYLFADYNCNYTTWRNFKPSYYFRQCVDGGICSTDLI